MHPSIDLRRFAICSILFRRQRTLGTSSCNVSQFLVVQCQDSLSKANRKMQMAALQPPPTLRYIQVLEPG
jgi:hypothetical protein